MWAAYKKAQTERDRQLAARVSSETTGGLAAPSQEVRAEDVTMAVPEAVVGPQRPAPTVHPFQPYRSNDLASPQSIYRRAGITPVYVGQAVDQESLLLSFFGCKEAQWSDPHWTASAQERADRVARTPVDDNLYWCEEIS